MPTIHEKHCTHEDSSIHISPYHFMEYSLLFFILDKYFTFFVYLKLESDFMFFHR